MQHCCFEPSASPRTEDAGQFKEYRNDRASEARSVCLRIPIGAETSHLGPGAIPLAKPRGAAKAAMTAEGPFAGLGQPAPKPVSRRSGQLGSWRARTGDLVCLASAARYAGRLPGWGERFLASQSIQGSLKEVRAGCRGGTHTPISTRLAARGIPDRVSRDPVPSTSIIGDMSRGRSKGSGELAASGCLSRRWPEGEPCVRPRAGIGEDGRGRGMSEARGRLARRVGAGLVLLILATAVAAGAAWYRARSRRLELDEARRAMAAGHLGLARQRLIGLADRWAGDGEVLVLLGECELERGRRDGEIDPARDAAPIAWARVPASSPAYPRAAMLQATHLINAGRFSPAERVVDAALRSPPADPGLRYDLDRALSRVYRFEGRTDDVRRVLRSSWCRSFGQKPDPVSVLRELWLLDRSPMPVEAIRGALDKADGEDDRVWLGRANLDILTGRFADAAGWLDRALERRPADAAVWRAKLALAMVAGDVPGVHAAAEHLPAGSFEPAGIRSLRAWLAARLESPDDERRELAALIRDDPGNAPALERLAVLTFEAGQPRESEELRRRKAEIDRAHDRRRKLLLAADASTPAEELARLTRTLGREFDARAWSLLAETGAGADVRLARATELSAPYERSESVQCPADRADACRTTGRHHGTGPDRRRHALPHPASRRPPAYSFASPTRPRERGFVSPSRTGRPTSTCSPRRCRAAWACSTTTATAGSTSIACRAARSSARAAARTPDRASAHGSGRPATGSSATGATARSRTPRSGRRSPRSPGAQATGWASRSATTTTTATPTCS